MEIIDEGYCNTSASITETDSSETNAKTVCEQNSRISPTKQPQPRPFSATPQHVPVRITNRAGMHTQSNRVGMHTQSNGGYFQGSAKERVGRQKVGRTLLIGDSILRLANPEGLKSDVQKHSKSGAKTTDLLEDIKVYDLMAFNTVIIYVGGNDASSQVSDEFFQKKYDQLIGHIKTTNPGCRVYICKVAPRGDTDV